jgi:hypothetical protein
MKRTLLATVAAAALVAGTIAVSAQGGGAGGAGGGGGGGGMGGGGMGGGGAPSAAPAEKMDRGSGGRTTGQGTGSQMDRGSGGQMDRGSGGQDRGERAGQGAGERGKDGTTQNRDQPRTGQGQDGQKAGQTGQDTRQGQGTNQKAGQGQTGKGSASLNTEQRTKIRDTVLRGGSVNRVSNVNFKINVGTVVPRSVHLVTVPATIVEVHPAWRGFLYFVVNDEIIIVEPGTLRIVAVIT